MDSEETLRLRQAAIARMALRLDLPPELVPPEPDLTPEGILERDRAHALALLMAPVVEELTTRLHASGLLSADHQIHWDPPPAPGHSETSNP